MPLPRIVPIVEGHGEQNAVPLLLRRLLHEVKQRFDIEVAAAKDANGRNNLLKESGLEKFLRFARLEVNAVGAIVILDAESDCAQTLAYKLAQRAAKLHLPLPVVIVCATCEYEAWFLASLETIGGQAIKGSPGIKQNAVFKGEIEEKRDVKGWLDSNMLKGSYKPAEHQAPLTGMIDFTLARQRSRSFRRLEHALDELLDAIDNQTPMVTPLPKTPDQD